MAEFQEMAANLCSEDVLGSFKLLFLGSHLFWPQIHLILYLKEIFVIAFLKEKRISSCSDTSAMYKSLL